MGRQTNFPENREGGLPSWGLELVRCVPALSACFPPQVAVRCFGLRCSTGVGTLLDCFCFAVCVLKGDGGFLETWDGMVWAKVRSQNPGYHRSLGAGGTYSTTTADCGMR